ncbi:MAG: hypothetical protein ACE3JK_00900 [Sporolactobacillus sp.]
MLGSSAVGKLISAPDARLLNASREPYVLATLLFFTKNGLPIIKRYDILFLVVKTGITV